MSGCTQHADRRGLVAALRDERVVKGSLLGPRSLAFGTIAPWAGPRVRAAHLGTLPPRCPGQDIQAGQLLVGALSHGAEASEGLLSFPLREPEPAFPGLSGGKAGGFRVDSVSPNLSAGPYRWVPPPHLSRPRAFLLH